MVLVTTVPLAVHAAPAEPKFIFVIADDQRRNLAFRTQTMLQMAMAAHLAGESVRFDAAK